MSIHLIYSDLLKISIYQQNLRILSDKLILILNFLQSYILSSFLNRLKIIQLKIIGSWIYRIYKL